MPQAKIKSPMFDCTIWLNFTLIHIAGLLTQVTTVVLMPHTRQQDIIVYFDKMVLGKSAKSNTPIFNLLPVHIYTTHSVAALRFHQPNFVTKIKTRYQKVFKQGVGTHLLITIHHDDTNLTHIEHALSFVLRYYQKCPVLGPLKPAIRISFNSGGGTIR